MTFLCQAALITTADKRARHGRARALTHAARAIRTIAAAKEKQNTETAPIAHRAPETTTQLLLVAQLLLGSLRTAGIGDTIGDCELREARFRWRRGVGVTSAGNARRQTGDGVSAETRSAILTSAVVRTEIKSSRANNQLAVHDRPMTLGGGKGGGMTGGMAGDRERRRGGASGGRGKR